MISPMIVLGQVVEPVVSFAERLVEIARPYGVAPMLIASLIVLLIMVHVGPRAAMKRAFAFERLVLVLLFARLLKPALAPEPATPPEIDLILLALMAGAGYWLAWEMWQEYRPRREGEPEWQSAGETVEIDMEENQLRVHLDKPPLHDDEHDEGDAQADTR